jgi:phage protein D
MAELLSQMYLKIDGTNASEEIMDNMISMEVDDNLLLPDMFSLCISDPSFKWTDSATFDVGKKIEISARSNGSTIKLLTGEITSIEPEFNEIPTVIIRGYDQSHRLHRTKETKTFIQETDSDIAKKIARQCGLKSDIDSTREVHEYICQDNMTDMEFLQDRAQRIGYRMYVEEGKLFFKQAPQTEPNVPVLEWGVNLLEFQARMATANQVTEVTVRGWDPKTKKEIIGQAKAPQDTPQVGERRSGGEIAKRAFNTDSKEIVVNRPVSTQVEADEMAQSICDEMGNSFIQAEGTCLGNPAVQAGVFVELKGVGQRFSGRYRITNAIHRYDESGYNTNFTISGRKAKTLSQLLMPKSGSKHSVMVGLVTNNLDPEGLGRVKVKFPTLHGNEESNWARLVSPMAGNGRGFEFIPEVNDEVLVAFEHDDTNRPFILGSLWNGKDKPPESSDKAVNSTGKVEKRIIRSRAGHTITLDDADGNEKLSIVDKTEKNAIEISSNNNLMEIKAGSKVEVKTGDGHKIVLDSSGISIEASAGKDLTLKANNIKVEATVGVDVKANATMNIDGGTTTVKGKTMTLDGGTSLTAKGGVVMIN